MNFLDVRLLKIFIFSPMMLLANIIHKWIFQQLAVNDNSLDWNPKFWCWIATSLKEWILFSNGWEEPRSKNYLVKKTRKANNIKEYLY